MNDSWHVRIFGRSFYGAQAIGAESGTHSEEIRIMAEMLADFFEEVSPQLRFMKKPAATASRTYITEMCQSPALRAHVSEHVKWYSSPLLKHACGIPATKSEL